MMSYFENYQPRTVAVLIIAVVSLMLVAEITYLLLPQIKSYRKLDASNAMLEQAVGHNDSLSNQLQRIDSEVKILSRQLHGDMAQLPVKQMESFVIGRLQKVSWETDVELVSVQPGSGGQVQNFREQIFEVKLSAHYHDFFEWLQIINDELGYIVVKKFEIRPDDRDNLHNPRLSLQLTLVSYRIEANHAS
jgi:Tfp pilus assembly protein PilO